jgi:HPt (histidine-containing phosphotransfer) domain-containing protein
MKAALDALAQRFAGRCRDNRAELALAVEAKDRDALKHLAHKLVGAAATFGHPELTAAAAAVEDALDAGTWPDGRTLDRLDHALASVAVEAP